MPFVSAVTGISCVFLLLSGKNATLPTGRAEPWAGKQTKGTQLVFFPRPAAEEFRYNSIFLCLPPKNTDKSALADDLNLM